MSTMKPSRSDEVSDPDQQIKNSNEIRAGFDSLAPKRPTKPPERASTSRIFLYFRPNHRPPGG
ncbi:hypothetical protein HID58_090560 [Brassica napus]|uniref:Uncharacterized protein n=1 Tax=Brassica napus TaxID=3708 RepID=A0ABQ7WXC6_BRANA|nr:hypothetical protein HID58_090560 [Brassica napus]